MEELIKRTFESNLPILQKIALLINTRKHLTGNQQELCNYYLTKLYDLRFGKEV